MNNNKMKEVWCLFFGSLQDSLSVVNDPTPEHIDLNRKMLSTNVAEM